MKLSKTNEERLEEITRPSVCDLLPVRDFLDGVMIRSDGSYVAAFRLDGAMSYFGDDNGRNETKHRLESLFLTIPEESMRVQFRYEVIENIGPLIDRYEAARSTTSEVIAAMDQERVDQWRAGDRAGAFLTRIAAVYFIWNPVTHAKGMEGSGGPMKKAKDAKLRRGGIMGIVDYVLGLIESVFASVSVSDNITATRAEHFEKLNLFESLMMGVESSLRSAELQPTRMSHEELFIEIKRSLCPTAPDSLGRREFPLAERYISAREQLAAVSILGRDETHLNIDGLLWSSVSFKLAPDATSPGVMRELLTLGIPMVINTHLTIPDQRKVLAMYKSRFKKMQAAMNDGKGGVRTDVGAAVAAREILAVQQQIIASSVKTAKMSISVMIRTSHPAYTEAQYEAALQEIEARTQKVLHVIGRMNGARGFTENLALRDLFIDSLPGMAGENKRDLDLLTEHAADLVPVEMPWPGTLDDPAMLFQTPYRQLIPISHFSPRIENANMILAATSGTGKGVLVGKMLLTYARQGAKISILERGDSYESAIEYLGGKMLTMSLDSENTINPFDLEKGETEPSNDQISFLKTLVRYMVGESSNSDSDLLDSAILLSIRGAYTRAAMRVDPIPTLGDVRDELKYFIDEDKSERVNEEAKLASTKLRPWVDDGMYAKLFDRQTTVDMNSPWLYFNIEKLKDDPKLETAMSLVIAYATTKRTRGNGRQHSIVVLDECWQILGIPALAKEVIQLFRTSRKSNSCVWGVSQSIADFTGTLDKPNEFGEAILSTTAFKMIGRQKGNLNVLRDFVHLNETTINYVKDLPMTEKGKKSEFLVVIGEKSETTCSIEVYTTAREYWILTTYPRDKHLRKYWHRKHHAIGLAASYALLAAKYPRGTAGLDPLPEEAAADFWGPSATPERIAVPEQATLSGPVIAAAPVAYQELVTT
jgi:type IV secretory pathway VirB4 component